MKIPQTPYLILIVVLGGITITTVVAETDTNITTYPYVITDGSNQRLVIISSGNVGIGTANPRSTLHLLSSGNTELDIGASNSNNVMYEAAVGSNPRLTFGLWNGAYNDYMTIANSGSVGIGTNQPDAYLAISGGFSLPTLHVMSPSNTELRIGNSSVGYYWAYVPGSTDRFTLGRNAGSYNDMFTINQNGNVGIGTNGPAQKLEVNGNIQADGNYTTASVNKELKISAPSGIPICIGTGC